MSTPNQLIEPENEPAEKVSKDSTNNETIFYCQLHIPLLYYMVKRNSEFWVPPQHIVYVCGTQPIITTK